MSENLMLKSMKLINYKGFEQHTIHFRQTNVLVGANNAGKSTVLGALRLIAAMLPQARRILPNTTSHAAGRTLRGWPITAAAIESSAFATENIRYDFRDREARIEVITSAGAKIIAAWLSEEDAVSESRGMYYVIPPESHGFATPMAVARQYVPTIAVVPTLSPLDDRESYVGDDTLRRNTTSRRSSRYFRNALYRISEPEWQDFTRFVYAVTPEVSNLSLYRADHTKEDDFDLFYAEEGTRHEREIVWAGDGIQIWLQVLYHLWRQKDESVIILDEPDVFLHPDLQRRLAQVIFRSGQQVIVATHSIEVLAEADPGSAVWVDRSRRSSERPRGDGVLGLLGRRLGSGYELSVARALRSSTVLFVEGDDAPVLALMAARLGMEGAASPKAYAIVPLGGFTRNSLAAGFAETMTVLGGEIRSFVLLDSDLRSKDSLALETAPLQKAGAVVHVWKRRELENYLIQPQAIAAVSGVALADACLLLSEVLELHRKEAERTLTSQRIDENNKKIGVAAKWSPKTVLEKAAVEFDGLWSSMDGKLSVVDAKVVIHDMNNRLQALKKKTVNLHSLARNLDQAAVPQEVQSMLERFEDVIAGR